MLEVHIENQKENVVVRDREFGQIVPKSLTPKGMEDVFAGRELTTAEQVGSGDLIRGVVPVFSASSPKEVIGFVTASYYFPAGLVDKINVI